MKLLAAIFCMSLTLNGISGNDVVIGILGNSVSIDCKLPVTQSLVWQSLVDGVIAMNGELTTGNSTKFVIERYDGGQRESLVIRDVTLADETEYRCFDLHDKESVYATDLHVLVRPTYKNTTYPTEPVLEGTEVMLVCEAGGGKPPPEITWYTQDVDGAVRILNGLVSHTLYSNGTGHVTNVLQLNVTRDLFGWKLLCSVSVPVFYTDTMEINLDVHMMPLPPVISGYLGCFDEDTRLKLECTCTGNHPTASVFWEVDGFPVSETELVVIPETDNTSTVKSFLTWTLTRDFDGSLLTCAVTNSALKARRLEPIATNITLRMSYKPKVTALAERYVVKQGENVTLECRIDALPITDIKSVFWTHNGIVLGHPTYDLSENASVFYLHLTNVTRTDTGNYTCHAANRLGSSFSQTKLSVLHSPQCVTGQIQRLPVEIGSTVRLLCQMYAFPTTVTLFWKNRITKETITSIKADNVTSTEGLVEGAVDIKIGSRDQYIDVECVGTNSETGPGQPCLYRIEPPAPAEPPSKCSVRVSGVQVSVSCQAGFHGGSTQTFLLQILVGTSYETITKSSSPIFGFRSQTNTTIRVCAVNENFEDVIRCSVPLPVHVVNSGYHENSVVEARGGDTGVYIAGGITGFVGLLIITSVSILFARRRRKNVDSGRHSPTIGVLGNRGKPVSRLAVGSKWWYSVKPSSVGHATPRSQTPAMSRSSRDVNHVVCSTPYYGNKQPDLNVVGNSPIFPADVQIHDVTDDSKHHSINANSTGGSTGFIVSSMTCKNGGSEWRLTGDDLEKVHQTRNSGSTFNEDTSGEERGKQHKKVLQDDAKSIDVCGITLNMDYSAGDIADVLDNTRHSVRDQTFNLDKPNSNIVVDGTTLSFEADFSATLSNITSRVKDGSGELESTYRDDVSFVSNILSLQDNHTVDRSMITMVSNQLYDKKVLNTTYDIHSERETPLRNLPGYNESDSEMDSTIIPGAIPFETTFRIASYPGNIKHRSQKPSAHCVDYHTSSYISSSECVDRDGNHDSFKLCQSTYMTDSVDENVDKLAVPQYDTFAVNDPRDDIDDESSESERCDLRNNSFRIAIDNSRLNNTVVNNIHGDRNRLTMYLLNENYMNDETMDATLNDTSCDGSVDAGVYYDNDTRIYDETVAYV